MLISSMRALALLVFALLATAPLSAQATCSEPVKTAALRGLYHAQAAALAFKQSPMDSGVPSSAVPALRMLKAALAAAADAVVACHSATDTPTSIGNDLETTLHAAAPGLPASADSPGSDDTPVRGTLGNNVEAHATSLSTQPALLGVELSSSVPCGSDSQLLIYQAENGRWQRKARWSAGLAVDQGQTFSSDIAGDFFLTAILPMDGDADGWRAVVAHGTPWCTSRHSSLGLAVLGPSPTSADGHLAWHKERSYSRDDFEPRLTASRDTFEFRINRDAMEFDETGYERTVIYHYRVSPAGLTRIEPIALNARGFIEEWLSMPADEAREQQQDPESEPLQRTHRRAQQLSGRDYTSWSAGPVRACTAPNRFQVAFDSQLQHFVEGKPGGSPGPLAHHFFELQQAPAGYELLSVSAQPDPTCSGPDLMHKPAAIAKPR